VPPGFGGDIPLPNVTVKLYSDPNGDGDPSDGTVLAVTTSDSAGYYEFLNLGAARYVVVQEDQLGYSSVADTAAANDNRIPVNVTTLTSYPNNNFLDRVVDPATYGSISGQVRNDTNANGNLADSESGLAGAVVTLFTDPNGDGNPNDGIAFGVPVTTTASGTYSFTNLPPGTYVVVETDPAGFVSTADVVNPNNNQIPVNLAPSAAVTGRDFLDSNNNAALGVIGNQVWLDTNNDGLFGGGESGVNGVVVELYLSSQTPGVDSPYLTTTTSGGGLYQFANVPAGSYVVYFPIGNFSSGGALASAPLSSTVTAGIDNTTDNDDNGIQTSTAAAVTSPVIALAAGETDNTKDFGFVPTTSLGTITGSVLADIDNNDTGDSPLSGVTLTLKDSSGNDIDSDPNTAGVQPTTTVTNGSGNYSFTNVPPGSYRVVETDPSGYNSVTSNTVTPVVVTPGGTTSNINFVDEQPGSITGSVLIDTDNNDSGDSPLAGVTLTLLNAAGNPVDGDPNTAGVQPVTTVTAANGSYSFTALPPGTYGVRETQPSGYLSASDKDGGDLNEIRPITVSAGAANTANNFVEEQPGTITGSVLADIDNNDTGDSPLSGVTLTLKDSSGNDIDSDPNTAGVQPTTTVTNGSGNYSFTNVPPGSYRVVETDPSGYNSVTSNTVTLVVVTPGGTTSNINFVDEQPGSITGSVLIDTDNNDSGDSPLAGVTLTLLNAAGNPVDGDPNTAGVQPVTTVTAANGSYNFTALPPGTYGVRETQPSGYISVSDKDSGDLNEIRPITVSAGAANTANNFVEEQPGTITGSVLADIDNNDTGDSPLSGVTLTLKDSSGNDIDSDPNTAGVQPTTTVTNGSGNYSFTNVPPGSYRVVETDPSGYNSVTSNTVTPVVVTPGGTTSNINFVDEQPGSITGSVLADTNNDNTGDTPLIGVILTLVDSAGNPIDGDTVTPGLQPITTTTNGSGLYSFTNLPAGTYGVKETQPSGYTSLSDKDGGDLNEIRPIVVTAGTANTGNNFAEISLCPDTWADWKQLHPTETAGGNPDMDAYDNFAEFAFAMPYDSGKPSTWLPSGTAWIIRPSAVDGVLEGVFIRPKGAPTNVTYTLQYAAQLGAPTIWLEKVIDLSNSTFVDNGDCTETVTILDLALTTNLSGGEGIVRIKAALDEVPPTGVDHTSYSEVEGWKTTALGTCCRTYNNPFQHESVFTGTVATVSGQVLTFAGESLNTLLTPGQPYYLEVTSGDNEGHRFDVVSATVDSITLVNDSSLYGVDAPFSTRTGALPVNLESDMIAIRRHRTLDQQFPPSGIGQAADRDDADQVKLLIAGQWVIYWNFDGVATANPPTIPIEPRWVEFGDAGYLNKGATVIPPGQGLFFDNRHAPTTVLAYGEVRNNKFIRPIAQGTSLVGGGYPLDQSAMGTGSRQMTYSNTPGLAYFGSRDLATADTFYVWKGDTVAGTNGYDSYFLNVFGANPAKWIKIGDASSASRNAELLMLGDGSISVRAKSPINTYTVPTPWSPN
jgi:uncharacterized protein (DUF2141 family)